MVWYDKHRRGQDGTLHEGRLELITWEGTSEDGEKLGFGGAYIDEADDLRRDFEVKYQGNEARFFGFWPQGFRWTCCGLTGDQDCGCDHHGSGSTPCCCDFCKMGKPLPNSLYMRNKQATRGLSLRRGPDPRSYNPVSAGLNEMMRSLMGLPTVDGDEDAAQGNPLADTSNKAASLVASIMRSPNASAAFAAAQQDVQAQQQHSGAGSSSSGAGGARQAAGAAADTSGSGRDQSGQAGKVWSCSSCGVKKPVAQMFYCSGCKVHKKVPYCSHECQTADWPSHKKACKEAKKAAKASSSSKAAAMAH